jgi:hypothetical protein
MDRAAALAARSTPDSFTNHMRSRISFALLALSLSLAAPAAAQVSGPVAGAPGQPVQYYPLYGGTLGIAIPAGRLGDEHASGYHLGGLLEWAVPNQAYALRGEAMFERFALKSGKAGSDVSVFAVGPTIVYRLAPATATSGFLTGGIAIYHATTETFTTGTGITAVTVERPGGTRPGFNIGTGINFPLTDFSAIAEVRLHVMLTEGKPVLTLPLSVGAKF